MKLYILIFVKDRGQFNARRPIPVNIPHVWAYFHTGLGKEKRGGG